jgi:hypothetical protein
VHVLKLYKPCVYGYNDTVRTCVRVNHLHRTNISLPTPTMTLK